MLEGTFGFVLVVVLGLVAFRIAFAVLKGVLLFIAGLALLAAVAGVLFLL